MSKLGFYFDINRCTGCRTCQVACKDKNRLDVGIIYRQAKTYCVGSYPDVKGFSFSFSCNHCESPACAKDCPVGAMYVHEDGSVQHDDALCIGCQTCVEACPYGVPKYNEETNLVGKCDSCKAIRDDGGVPACVGACPMRCLDFGDMEELKEKYGDELVSEIPILPSEELTHPGLLLKVKEAALSDSAKEVPI